MRLSLTLHFSPRPSQPLVGRLQDPPPQPGPDSSAAGSATVFRSREPGWMCNSVPLPALAPRRVRPPTFLQVCTSTAAWDCAPRIAVGATRRVAPTTAHVRIQPVNGTPDRRPGLSGFSAFTPVSLHTTTTGAIILSPCHHSTGAVPGQASSFALSLSSRRSKQWPRENAA
jgi:hypothetical protein